MPVELNKARERLKEMFLSSLREERLPWQQPWVNGGIPHFGIHQNPISGVKYHGLNAVMLWATATANQFEDSRWCTFQQAKEKGWSIRKGEHGTPIEFWSFYDTVNKQKISVPEFYRIQKEEAERVPDIKPCSCVYIVFNGTQIDGIPELPKENNIAPEFTNTLIADFSRQYLANAGVKLRQGYEAAYVPSEDTIIMPPKEKFYGEIEYYDTLFHECAHSTAHPSRLNRETDTYAIEELRAEIAGAFLISAVGVQTPKSISDNNKAYVQSWAASIQNDPNILFQAIKSADTIADYVIKTGQLVLLKEQALALHSPLSEPQMDSFDEPEL